MRAPTRRQNHFCAHFRVISSLFCFRRSPEGRTPVHPPPRRRASWIRRSANPPSGRDADTCGVALMRDRSGAFRCRPGDVLVTRRLALLQDAVNQQRTVFHPQRRTFTVVLGSAARCLQGGEFPLKCTDDNVSRGAEQEGSLEKVVFQMPESFLHLFNTNHLPPHWDQRKVENFQDIIYRQSGHGGHVCGSTYSKMAAQPTRKAAVSRRRSDGAERSHFQ
ncbi:interferon beta-like [Arapaima gigas]